LKRVSKGYPNIVTLHDYFEVRSPSIFLPMIVLPHPPPHIRRHTTFTSSLISAPVASCLIVSVPRATTTKRECYRACPNIGSLNTPPTATPPSSFEQSSKPCSTSTIAVLSIEACSLTLIVLHPLNWIRVDLKPENLIFRTKKEDADIMIADFGLSRMMEEEKLQMLTEICGTPGVRVIGAHSHFSRRHSSDGDCSTWHPRSSRRVSDHFIFPCVWHLKCLFTAGHGKPVDIWAMGVITYFLLCGKVTHSILTACVLVNVYQDTLPSIATLNSKKWKQSSPAITNLSQACYDSRGPIFVS
jgi:serine/threonine protein kinase